MRPAVAAGGSLALHECRLEHPLKISSVAARCGVLQVAENPAQPSGPTIGLHVAVVPALNRRSRSAPLFLLAGGPGQAASDLYVSYAGAFARVNRNHDIVLLDQRGTVRRRIVLSVPSRSLQRAPSGFEAIRPEQRLRLDRTEERARAHNVRRKRPEPAEGRVESVEERHVMRFDEARRPLMVAGRKCVRD